MCGLWKVNSKEAIGYQSLDVDNVVETSRSVYVEE